MRLAVILAALTAAACSEAPRGEPAPLDLPDWRVCIEDYDGSGARLHEATTRGEEAAMLCSLAVIEGAGREDDELELLYGLYRLRGEEPAGLDVLVRRRDRQELATWLGIWHQFNPYLEPIPPHPLTGCPRYDAVTRDLILRARPSEETRCLPRGQR